MAKKKNSTPAPLFPGPIVDTNTRKISLFGGQGFQVKTVQDKPELKQYIHGTHNVPEETVFEVGEKIERQVILGKIPAKSNCYKIITFPGKFEDPNDDQSDKLKEFIHSVDGHADRVDWKGVYKILKKMDKSHGSLAKQKELIEYEESFSDQCKLYRNHMIESEFMLVADVYFESRRSDLDNCLKILLDCLQNQVKAIKNDNLCYHINVRKHIDKVRPRVEFHLLWPLKKPE